MTQTDNAVANQDLATMKLPELRKVAAEKGLKGVSALRKGELIEAIKTGSVPAKASATSGQASAQAQAESAPESAPEAKTETSKAPAKRATRRVTRSAGTPTSSAKTEDKPAEKPAESADSADQSAEATAEAKPAESSSEQAGNNGEGDQRYESRSAARRARRYRARQGGNSDEQDHDGQVRAGGDDAATAAGATDAVETKSDSQTDANDDSAGDSRQESSGQDNRNRRNSDNRDNRQDNRNNRDNRDNRDNADDDESDNRGNNQGNRNNRNNNRGHSDDDEGGNRRGRRGRRNRRGRDRDGRDNRQDNRGHGDNRQDGRGGQGNQGNQDIEPEELQEVAGILDVVDNNAAFVRTTGYRSNPADVFVQNNMIRQFGMRSGDAVVGQVRQNSQSQSHGSGRNRSKYNKLVRVDSVNGMDPQEAKQRPEFHKLTPLYPNQRLRLETEPNILTTRVIDLVMPIGKGQRALIVSPPKAGKTTILQNIANAIATNNPECYLMVVLVDERPEEVTDMQRSVKGEVIASTFDRPPAEHTAVAELAIERAKRLVEMGQDVVVLLDSITRLGRAYNNSSPASGRILSGGVDSNALYPPKRFLGAARNIEDGGSLTIIATAMVETGSAGDTVIFEEFKGTGNAELKLDRKIAERRVFPAVDVNPSGTRKDELLLVPEEARIMHKLRRILSALDSQAAIDLLIKQLKKTKSNGEFLMGVAKSAPMVADTDTEEYL
ncbi:transcription termination factor Rho [Corynebacterium lubricantis]|uniref:transcription termination factor Rho n=1 Tax=Corynebacterium lubricantis TaxID=541095 RepID=UPI00036E632E|nr:transcription termination factor Rho [Corynebacterium lubricantis]